MRHARRFIWGAIGLGSLLTGRPASAQLNLGPFRHSLAAAPSGAVGMPHAFLSGPSGKVPVVVRSSSGAPGAPELTTFGRFAIASLDPARIAELADEHPGWSFEWSPPRHVLLDRADTWVRASAVRQATSTSGKGVVVGIVDTGADLAHADLQTSDHKTRVAWLLDVTKDPAGLHADFESAYGCDNTDTPCGVFAASDIDALLTDDISGNEPTDDEGHGTHVASLAAGNGLGSKTPRYIGVAPEATYVIARVAQRSGGISDTDVLRGVKFVFDRAADLGMPAVVNLSLGSDFGAHDGSSALESELAAMVGPDFPGRAIVVAAGNSAGLYAQYATPYPPPYGVHTEVHVPRDSVSLVPLITPATSAAATRVHGTASVWIGFRDGDDVRVGFDDQNGTWVPPIALGKGTTLKRQDYEVTILNGVQGTADSDALSLQRNGAVLVLDGVWNATDDFKIHLEGHGTAELWVQGSGDLDPTANYGAMFPRAFKEGTINVPGSASGLISVGATLNRTDWISAAGTAIDANELGLLAVTPLDSMAYFSSAGPNALGEVKPDLVAPGVFVAGAMAASADPRRNGGTGLFASLGICPAKDECFVVDDAHAVTSGTSMSAPIVAGAIALLFERDPTLTQDAVRALLQAGARPLQGTAPYEQQVGPGALDLEGALTAATAATSADERVPGSASWLTLSESYAHPDPNWPLIGYVELRDDLGEIADGFDASRLTLAASPAVVHEPLTRVAPGFFRFNVSAQAGTGGQTLALAVSFDGQPLLTRRIPISVDRWVAQNGVSVRGGASCAFQPSRVTNAAGWLSLLLGPGLVLARRKRRKRRYILAR